YVFIAKQLQIGAVGVDMHAIVNIGDGIYGAFQQKLTTFLGLTQRQLGGAARTTFFEISDLPVSNQDQPFVFALRQRALGAEGQGLSNGIDIVALDQLNDRNVLRL